MSDDRQKTIRTLIFDYLSEIESAEAREITLYGFFNKTFKSNGLLTSDAFLGGRLVSKDEVRNVIRDMSNEGLVFYRDTLSDVYFRLSDKGVLALENFNNQTDANNLTSEDAVARRWSRLKAINVGEGNASAISSLIDKAISELREQKLTNEQFSQAASYMLAAKELLHAPAPPSEIIWDLIQKAAAIAGITQIVLQIFSALT